MRIGGFEFEKLDEEDVRLVLWFSEHYPAVLPDVLTSVAQAYSKRGILLNIQRLLQEFSPLST